MTTKTPLKPVKLTQQAQNSLDITRIGLSLETLFSNQDTAYKKLNDARHTLNAHFAEYESAIRRADRAQERLEKEIKQLKQGVKELKLGAVLIGLTLVFLFI